MDFDLSEEQKMLRDTARNFAEREIMPHVDEWDRQYDPVPKEMARGLLKQLLPLGYVSVFIPEELGGDGLGMIAWGLMYEELARAWASLAMIATGHGNVAHRIATSGTPEQQERYLPRLLSGDLIGAGAATEPNVGSDAGAVETTAVRQGDHYLISGTKTWITNGPIADVVVPTVRRLEPDGCKSLCRFIVEKEVSPFTARPFRKIGLRGSATGEVVFDNCPVPQENLLEDPAGGLAATLHHFNMARVQTAVQALGLAQAAFDAATQYVKERKQFGRPIGSFQLVQRLLANMIIEAEAARLLTYKALHLLDKGIRCRLECSAAKVYATEMAVRVTSDAIQVHGAYGLSDEYPVERYYRDARMFTIPDGTTEINQLIIGREVTGLRAFA
jgi:alkylation response protein AidB-like acyl-CoA dehydrogenase